MKLTMLLIFLTTSISLMQPKKIYDLKIKDIHGKDMNLGIFKGKKMLIVNVASECGYTPQYSQLQELYDTYNDKLTILACPSNDFGGQEPGNGEEIATFCKKKLWCNFSFNRKDWNNNQHPSIVSVAD